MERPLVSIGLLTYNHEEYIEDALKGLLSQEYEPIELIILDDASNDKTTCVIEHNMKYLQDRFVKVTYLKNKKNSGNIPYNCNCMIKRARGDFYYEISGDDILLPAGVQLLCEALQNHPECAAVHANMVQVMETYRLGDEINTSDTYWRNKDSRVEPDNLFQQLMSSNFIAAPTVMIRRGIFSQYGYHDESVAFEDYEYWLRISRTEKFYFLNEPVVLYRRAEISVTNFDSGNIYNKLQTAMVQGFLVRKKYIKELGKNEQLRCWQTFYAYCIRMCKQCQYEAGLDWLEEKRRADGIEADERQTDYKKLFERHWKEAEILAAWIEVKNVSNILGNYLKTKKIFRVAIYGYSRLGIVLQKELLRDGISVDYVIDQKGKMLECPFPVYTLESSLPAVDAVIVAPVELYDVVKPVLSQKVDGEILDLGQIVEELKAGDEFTEKI